MISKYTLILSIICIGTWILLFSSALHQSSGQKAFTPQTTKTSSEKDIFRVAITLFGVTKDTGYVFTYVKVNDETSARFYNASNDDIKDKDGIVDSIISFPNETIKSGASFTACNVVLKDLVMYCKSGFNIPQRIESIQFALPTFNPASK